MRCTSSSLADSEEPPKIFFPFMVHMFQDVETGHLGLVMEYGGESLASRQREEGDEVLFTKQEW